MTPESAWTSGEDRAAFDKARAERGASGPAVIRDYVKSMKHDWDTAMYVPDLADAVTAWQVASRFRALREDEFTGGFVLRRFEPLTSGEARTWWTGGECALVTPHPDTPRSPTPGPGSLPLARIAQPVRAIRQRRVTSGAYGRRSAARLASGIGGLDNGRERSSPALPGQSYLDLEVLPCALAAWAFGTHRGS